MNYIRSFILVISALLFSYYATAQNLNRSVSGIVFDAISNLPVQGATISLNGKDLKSNNITDESGIFKITDVPPGRYNLVITHISYYSYIISELFVVSGQELFLNVPMIYSTTEIPPVDITADGFVPIKDFTTPVSAYGLSVEQTNRIAANYNDPARLATSYPGVIGDNDQSNNLSIRGNSPNGLIWKLQGLEIVNPNHTTNAGTFSDRLTQTGGGVNILSRQLLGNSQLYTGAWNAAHGNAISGIFDIQLRPGNKNRTSYTVQTGLIGLEFATEGPFNKKANSSYLVNYRFSTVGLLSAIGVDLGDEVISFQDLSFNLDLPAGKVGNFTIFGTSGYSSNEFEAERDSSMWEFDKDRYDITYKSSMGALGFTHKLPLTKKSSINTAGVISAIESTREGDRLNKDLSLTRLEYDDQEQLKVSGQIALKHRIRKSHQLTFAFDVQHQEYRYLSKRISLSGQQDAIVADGNALLYQPFVSWMWQIGDKIILNSGLHSMYYNLNESSVVEPRVALHIKIHPRHQLKFAYGQHSQLQLPGTYFTHFSNSLGQVSQPNTALDFNKSSHYVAGLSNDLGMGWGINTEFYYQDISNVPVSVNRNSSFSALNLIEGYVTDTLVNKGTGSNYGIEFTLQKQLRNAYYLLLSYTYFNSTYKALDGIERNTRFNGNYAIAYSAGREMDLSNDEKNRWLNINIRVLARGGYRKTPVDQSASAVSGETIFDESKAYTQQFKDYFRTDFSLTLSRNKEHYTRTWALDIQNLLNTENIAWEVWDNRKATLQSKYQLGIIPILSYRLNF